MKSVFKTVAAGLVSVGMMTGQFSPAYAQASVEEVVASCADAAACALAVQNFLASVAPADLETVRANLQASLTEAVANGDITQASFDSGFAESNTDVADGGIDDNPLDVDVAGSTN